MIVDFHAHLGREDPGAPPFLRHLFDVEGYLGVQEEAGIARTVLSYALAEDDDPQLDSAKGEHDFLLGLIERYPDRFSVLTAIDPFGESGWLDEADRCLEGGAAGLCFPTSRGGRYLDAEAAQDAWAFANERGTVVFLHPSDSPFGVERAGDAIVREWVGRPYDTGICLARMLLADTLSAYPNVRLVVAHSGGTLPMLVGRLDSVYQTLERRAAMFGGGGGPPGGGPPGGGPPGGGPPGGPRGGPPGPPGPRVPEEAALKPSIGGERPSGRLGQLYLDTASYHPAALRAAIETVGAERLVFGTDYPPAGRSPKPTLDLVESLELSDEDRDRILGGNARALLDRSASPVAT